MCIPTGVVGDMHDVSANVQVTTCHLCPVDSCPVHQSAEESGRLKVKVVSPSPTILLVSNQLRHFPSPHPPPSLSTGMVKLRKYPSLMLLLIYLGIQVESDANDHRYSEGDTVPFYANKIGPFRNSRETYAYYELPFCSRDVVKEKKLNLGEMLNGDRLVSTPYSLEFLVDKDLEVLCNKTLSKTDVSKFIRAIDKNYYMQLHYDDLPIWAFIGMRNEGIFNGRIKTVYSLYKHFDFEVFYNKDQVIEVILQMANSFTDITEDKEVDVGFTYSVKWTMTQQLFDRRMEIYTDSTILPHNMPIHHHSITFSSVTLVILIVSLLTFYLLVLRKDISKNLADVEEDILSLNKQEEIGWKNVHGDVFKFPQHKSLFAVALGVSSQLLLMIIAILALRLLGVFQPYMRGIIWNALIIVYAVTFVVSGYTSVSFYSQLEGTNWIKNLLVAGGLYFGASLSYFYFPRQCCHLLWINYCIATESNSHVISLVDIHSITIASFRRHYWENKNV
ncbi:unnamed protein product [Lactuca virosa]|uniref:Transmembrane 9 superfamily member n=1 Tax=Lactuca virosa TaxID=75947 RepID=A0AAU9MD69_9ASTR|nr:unnamed protein product [Lactuca virosa]